jgi:hypothetical protein
VSLTVKQRGMSGGLVQIEENLNLTWVWKMFDQLAPSRRWKWWTITVMVFFTTLAAQAATTIVSLSTSTLSFPSTIVGTTSNVQYITVNTGNAPFVLTDRSLTGTDFAEFGTMPTLVAFVADPAEFAMLAVLSTQINKVDVGAVGVKCGFR